MHACYDPGSPLTLPCPTRTGYQGQTRVRPQRHLTTSLLRPNGSRLTLQRHARKHAHKGGSGAEPFGKTAHRRIPTEPVRSKASPSGFRPPPLVPGFFWLRARVILLPGGPTHPIPRLPVPGKVPTFPPPEPPLLLVGQPFTRFGTRLQRYRVHVGHRGRVHQRRPLPAQGQVCLRPLDL
jgi:hypothetical protein